MRCFRTLLAVLACCAFSMACAPAGFAAAPVKLHHHRGRRAAHRPAGKPKPAVWTLSEYSKGKLHKLSAGSPYYGLLRRWSVVLVSHKEVHGFKWTEEHPFDCETGSVSGTLKSNRVATPEVALETLVYGYCPELSTDHLGFENIEEFTPWSSSELSFALLPARLTLEGDKARLAPGSDFEVEVVDLTGGETRCKYFSLTAMNGSVSPKEPETAAQLGLSFLSVKLAPEQFTGLCPEEALVYLVMSSYVGPYGAAMFAEDG